MNKLQRDILFWLKESRKEQGMSPPQIAAKTKSSVEKVTVELGILSENNLVTASLSPTGRIKRAKIKTEGEVHFKESTTIVQKESVQEQINQLKEKITVLEEALKQLQENPTEENKKTFLEKLDTVQSVANGFAPLVKAGLDLFK